MTHALAGKPWTAIDGAPLVLVPLGSTEQHGPHLPVHTDAVIAGAVARGMAERMTAAGYPHAIEVAPTLQYGASGEHQSFPGTVSIGEQALRDVVVELARSLSTWARRVVFVNGHGGNLGALSLALPQLIVEKNASGWVPCAVDDGDAHAGRTETSVMLAIDPESVRLDAAAPGNLAPLSGLLPSLREGGVAAVSPNGVLGDPTGANAEEGGLILEKMIGAGVRRVAYGTTDVRGCLRDPDAGRSA